MEALQHSDLEVGYISDRTDGEAAALSSWILDVATPRHDRGCRALACFLLVHVGKLRLAQIFAVELRNGERLPTVYCFDRGFGAENASQPLFPFAHRGRLKWLKRTEYCTMGM